MSTVGPQRATDSFSVVRKIQLGSRKTRSFYHRACACVRACVYVCNLKDLGCVVELARSRALESEEETRSWRYLKRKCGSGRPLHPLRIPVSLSGWRARENQDDKRVAAQEPRGRV